MVRILRAFAWLRWRTLLNSLERHGGRDALERFSVAFDQLSPIIVALVMIPSALGLAGAGVAAGWSLAGDTARIASFGFLRAVLLGGCVFALIGPILLPTGDRTNAVRLLLLPIPRGVLYLGQMLSTLADPWMMLVAAVVLGISVGLTAGGAIVAAVFAAAAGILLLLVLAGLGLVVTSAVHLAVRDRRRGELLALLAIVLLPMIGILPGFLGSDDRRRQHTSGTEPRTPEEAGWQIAFERHALPLVPSELYLEATREATDSYAATTGPLLALVAMSALLHGVAFAGFARLLNSPGSGGGARAPSGRPLWRWGVPGVSAGTSAVAVNQLKLALRTPRGRATILSPFVLFLIVAAVMSRSTSGAQFVFIAMDSGVSLAAFACYLSLLSMLPLAVNQFAIDGAGLTLALLAPLNTRALLAGKAIGNALIAAIPASACFLGAATLFPTGHPAFWLCIPLTLIATYLLVAPIAAALSAALPRAVDLNSAGQGSNAHGTAGLLGTLAFLIAGTPCLLLARFASEWLDRPALAPVFLLLWTAISAALSVLMFGVAARVFERRRENLGMVV